MISWKNLAKIKISSATFKSKSGGKPSPGLNPKEHHSAHVHGLSWHPCQKKPLFPLCPVTSPCLEGDFPHMSLYFCAAEVLRGCCTGQPPRRHSVYATPSPKAHAAKQGEIGNFRGPIRTGRDWAARLGDRPFDRWQDLRTRGWWHNWSLQHELAALTIRTAPSICCHAEGHQ